MLNIPKIYVLYFKAIIKQIIFQFMQNSKKIYLILILIKCIVFIKDFLLNPKKFLIIYKKNL